jgi:3-oxoacyl-[acyl-carrier-protein] synthase-1
MAGTISIVGIGMMTPVGDSAAMTATSVEAGISAYMASSIYNKRFQPMTLALTPDEALPPLNEELEKIAGLTSRQRRMLRLAEKPLAEALSVVPGPLSPPLLLAGPEETPGCPKPIDDSFLRHLHVQGKGKFGLGKSKLLAQGRASGIEAMAQAWTLLSAQTEPFVLVGGVDTYLDLYLLGTLDMHDRVLADGVMDGFAPGEGAAFLLLASQQAVEKHALKPLAQVCQPALADEPGHRYSQATYKGDGLAQAMTAALSALNGQKANTVFSGMTGENLHAKEWGVANLRNQASLAEKLQFEHPADCYGDPGAAAGPLMIGLAALGMNEGLLPGPCLVYCSSEHEKRGALCLIQAPT